MAKFVPDQAQIVMDLYFQSFRPQDAFMELDDFCRLIVDERDALLEEEFYLQIRMRKNNFPIINPQWSRHVFIPVEFDEETKSFFAQICDPLYEFPFDEHGSGLQDVSPMGSGCGEFVPILLNQGWAVCMSATTDMVFYSLEGCRINLYNFNGCTQKLDARIIPSQSGLPFEQQTLPDGKASTIRERVLSKLFRDFAAKLGRIDMHNDSNPNPQPNETGKIYQNLKTE